MRPTTQRLFSVCALLFIVSVVGLVLALMFQWPAQLGGGSGNPNITAGELIANGTVTSLPLGPWIALVVFALLAHSRRWWGTLAVLVLCFWGRSSYSEGWVRRSRRPRLTYLARCSSRQASYTSSWACPCCFRASWM